MTHSVQTLIVDFSEQLAEFKWLLRTGDYPTVDMAVVFDKIISAIVMRPSAVQQLAFLANDMAYGEGLFEKHQLSDQEQARILQVIMSVGTAIMQELEELGAYEHHDFGSFWGRQGPGTDILPFKYTTNITNATIVLTRWHRAEIVSLPNNKSTLRILS